MRIRGDVVHEQRHLALDRGPDEPLIERWLRVPEHCAELAAVRGRIDPEVIRRETALYIHRSRCLSEQVFGRFIDLFSLPPKRAALRSR